MRLRVHMAAGLVVFLGALLPGHATPAQSLEFTELSDHELSTTYAAGLNLDLADSAHGGREQRPGHGEQGDANTHQTSLSAQDLARSLEGQLPWSHKQVASGAVQATVRTAQAMATITQMIPFGMVFLPTIGLPLVPPSNSQNKQSGSH